MYRRTTFGLCHSYHIPPFSRVGIFPLHLDPPTQQHRELFRLLLGHPHNATQQPYPQPGVTHSGAASAMGGQRGNEASLGGEKVGAATTNGTGRTAAAPVTSAASGTVTRSRLPSKFWYLEAFAESLHEDSQLAPFDALILVPNTRYPVSLRQSTHLAALAVLAARGIAGVHVDFTALEHPDAGMPVVYELAQRYHNSVLVHWLHDAYEMLNWRSFSELKMYMPMLLLQTNSLPVSAVSKPPPMAAVQALDEVFRDAAAEEPAHASGNHNLASTLPAPPRPPPPRRHLLHSRLYQDPSSVSDPAFAAYYTKAANHMHAQLAYRQQQSHPAIQQEWQHRSEVEVHGTVSSPVAAGVHATPGLTGTDAAAHEAEGEAFAGDGLGLSMPSPLTDSGDGLPGSRGGGGEGATGKSSSSSSSSSGADGGSAAPVDDVKRLVRGEWWLSMGGRGDDRVEVSRSYSNAASSSWLGAPMPLRRTRMAMDVSADAIADEYDASAGPDALRGEARVAGAGGGRRGDDRGEAAEEDADHDYATDEDEYEGVDDLLCSKAGGDFIITEDGLRAAPSASGQVGRAGQHRLWSASAANTSAEPPLPTATVLSSSSSAGSTSASAAARASGRGSDPNEPRSLFKEFIEVRESLEQMVMPAATADAPSPGGGEDGRACARKASASAAALPVGGKARDDNSNATTTTTTTTNNNISSHVSNSVRARRRVGGHIVMDPNSVVSRRNVRELLEEIYPSLLTRRQNRVASPAQQSSRLAAAQAALRTQRGAVSTTDALLDEVAVLQQSGGSVGADVLHGLAADEEAFGGLAMALPSLPMVEVHPVTRCTGADVRQVLWEQDVPPAAILTSGVTRYVESHGLYRDSRKNADGAVPGGMAGSATSLFAGPVGGEGAGSVPAGAHSPSTSGSNRHTSGTSSSESRGGGGGAAAFPSSAPSSTAAPTNAAALLGHNHSLLKRMMTQKEHAVMSFPGIIPRLELHYDKNNLLAREQYEKLKVFQCQDNEAPDLIVPIGGDGYMMHCIRNNWRRFIPFYGVNAGHVGYLLNDCATLEELFSSPLKLHTTNMLYCQAEKETETGERVLLSELAFNDAWVERGSGQTALIRILINGEERIRRLRGDGVLVSTAAGSTAYSQALGASPVPVGAPLIQVVGSNVVSPAQWRPVHLDQEDQVEFEVIDNIKRPCRCFVDSVDVGNVTRMLVRSSRVAGVTLAFSRSCDLQHKLYQMQFPKTL